MKNIKEPQKPSRKDGTSMNPFLVMAAAEKLSVLETEAYFTARKGQGDPEAFCRILTRPGGEPPRPGDQLPD